MKRRTALDVAELPGQEFSNRVPIWWGNVLMMTIEGAGLAILIATYFYIRHNFDTWPPAKTQLPDLQASTLNVAILVVSVLPMWYAVKLALKTHKARAIGALLFVCVVFGIAAALLRILEFKGVHTRWDTNAYGAIVWSILAVHFAHIIAATLETLAVAIIMFVGPVGQKHFVDITRNAVYWYFVALSWVVLYGIVFLTPRLL